MNQVFIFLHLLGVVIGMGGALASDFIFFSSIKDGQISRTEMRFLVLASKMVWLGLTVIILSGILIFLSRPEYYLNSPKFLAKMTIAAVIVLNGLAFYLWHIPRMERHVDSYFSSSDEFVRKIPSLISSGVISIVSWFSALILGFLRSTPFNYGQLMIIYLVIVLATLAVALIFRKKVFKS